MRNRHWLLTLLCLAALAHPNAQSPRVGGPESQARGASIFDDM
jgi:hypothetical protein